jgi:hypothetical protein
MERERVSVRTGGDGAPRADGGKVTQRRVFGREDGALELGNQRPSMLGGGYECEIHALRELLIRQNTSREGALH